MSTTPVMSIRLDMRTQKRLERMAKENGKTKSDFLRELIDHALNGGLRANYTTRATFPQKATIK